MVPGTISTTTTGAMAKGITHVPSNGGKWVYYDLTTGKMLYGERYVNYDQSHAAGIISTRTSARCPMLLF